MENKLTGTKSRFQFRTANKISKYLYWPWLFQTSHCIPCRTISYNSNSWACL